MPDHKVKVTIEGTPGAGKTTVALMLTQALQAKGADVDMRDDDAPQHIAMLNEHLDEVVPKLKVTIESKNAPKDLRYPYTYAYDLLRDWARRYKNVFNKQVISRSEAAKMLERMAAAACANKHALACALADQYLEENS
jgi:deoxyadenosine/deoxycytidine kinase